MPNYSTRRPPLAQVDISGLTAASSPTFTGLTLSANLVTTSTVDGRDVGTDGTVQDSHIANTSNPHSVTAAQLGVPTSAALAATGGAGLIGYNPSGTVQGVLENRQPLHANLTGLAGLVTAADTLNYWTGAGTPALIGFVSAIRALISATTVAGLLALLFPRTAVSAYTYSILAADVYLACTNTGAIDLSTAATSGRILIVKNSGVGTITLTGTVDTTSNPTLAATQAVMIRYNGSIWEVVS